MPGLAIYPQNRAMKVPWWLTSGLSLSLLLGLVVAWAFIKPGTYNDAVIAYNQGKFDEARDIWSALAEEEDAMAQYSLGRMYDLGVGVPQNDAKAAAWYKPAARKGNPYAQGNLAVLYATGRGVEQDLVLAYMYSTLAARGYEKWAPDAREAALRNRDWVAARMSPEELDQAQQRIKQWLAAVRAQQ